MDTMSLLRAHDALLLDLDGTVWEGGRAIDGAVETITAAGVPSVYITNNAMRAPQVVAEKLQAIGLDATDTDVVTAAQAVICLASVTAASAWMKSHPWNASGQIDFLDLRTWQTYGASLAIVCLGWAAARAGLRRFEPAARLIDPEWPSLDRVVAGALCGAQLLVAAGAVIPAIGHEMGSVPATFAAAALRQAASPAAWLLWGGARKSSSPGENWWR